MNYADSEKIREIFARRGFQEARYFKDADVIVLNTCSVRQRAEDKVLGLAKHFKALKEQSPEVKIVLLGCMAVRIKRGKEDCVDSKYRRMLKIKMPWVDKVIEEYNFGELEKFILSLNLKKSESEKTEFPQEHYSSVIAYLPVSTGCDNFCTYCIVPYTRGKEKNRKYDDIIDEVRDLVKRGYKLIFLLGQNVDSWTGVLRGKSVKFSKLLKEITDIPGDFWVTFLTSHPKDFSGNVIDIMKKSTKICQFVNLPVQSGADRILRRMNRGYSSQEYLEIVRKLKDQVSGVRLSTDFIVGFPSESEDDFAKTVEFVKTANIDMAYISEYSPRKGTPSYTLKDDVSTAAKKKRKKTLDRVIREKLAETNQKLIGKTLRCLVVARNIAKTFSLLDVRIVRGNISPGCFINVRIIDSSAGGLEGEIVV